MGIPLVHVTRLFQLVSQRRFAEAERMLERIRVKMKKSRKKKFNRGYLAALSGIVLTRRSGSESYEFFNNLNLEDAKTLKSHYYDFIKHAKSRFHADYDKGYFSAMADYMSVAIRMAQKKPEGNSN